MTWLQIILTFLIAAAISAWAVSRRERRKGERRRYKDTAAWIDRESSKDRPAGFAHAGFGNDVTTEE